VSRVFQQSTRHINLRRRQNLPPDPEVIASENQSDVVVAKASFGEHLDESRVVLSDGLRLDTCTGLRPVTFDFEPDGIHLVVAQPADADMFDADQFGQVFDLICQ